MVDLRPLLADEIAAAAEGSLSALRQSATDLAGLTDQAAELEERMLALSRSERKLAEREARAALETRALNAQIELSRDVAAEAEAQRQGLARSRRELDQAVAENARTAAALARREVDLRSEHEQMLISADVLSRERALLEDARAELEDRTRELALREARFVSRWRWLLRAWSWRPPLPGGKARLCELLLVPSSDGYKLLEQDGVALRPGSTLTGLLAEERTFVVSKIAPWAFDGRWCAYLQQQPSPTEKGVT